jgi:hypothetical protein
VSDYPILNIKQLATPIKGLVIKEDDEWMDDNN